MLEDDEYTRNFVKHGLGDEEAISVKTEIELTVGVVKSHKAGTGNLEKQTRLVRLTNRMRATINPLLSFFESAIDYLWRHFIRFSKKKK